MHILRILGPACCVPASLTYIAAKLRRVTHHGPAIKKQSYIRFATSFPGAVRRPPLAAVRSEHLVTFPDAGPQEEGPQEIPLRRPYPKMPGGVWRLRFGGVLLASFVDRPLPKLYSCCNVCRRADAASYDRGAGAVSAAVPSSRGPASGNVTRCSLRTSASGGRRMSLEARAPQCRPSMGQKLCRISRVSHALADQKAHR
jgi:hypothetical protein